MSQWMTLLQKEILEMWRNFKWIWVPITFILLGVKEPLSSYYLPQILDAVGGLPEGAVIKLPTPTAAEVLITGLGQYTTLGVLIIVLTTMGIISGERKSGVAAMILVKPVSFQSFVSAKWAGSVLLMWFSFFIGYLSTWYYTGLLFDWIPFIQFLQSFFFYALWLTVILTVTIFFSSSFVNSGMAGFLSLVVVIVLSLVSSTLSNWLEWSPAQLTNYANEVLLDNGIPEDTLPASLIAAVFINVLLSLSVFIFRKKELAQ
ncbi:putative transmembrane protein YxlG [Neobacillus rhizosphaerae]|uniref:Transmembrane protein YxlG n=1 Tax=Neobacillus rhizosphaerae TaxID=2880965 RepID=A0ABM9EXR0_9BACI|nr:ABC transporter permease subunit [Neobacillus rhizosphaerae]CAH2717483.1 putative transmembrane protein YxlG [Neobacillus rhizosphaerae]